MAASRKCVQKWNAGGPPTLPARAGKVWCGMQIGFNLPNSGPLSAAPTMARIASEGEAMGFDYLTMTDHVVLPDTKVPGYPYSESGSFYEEAPTERHEQLVGMAWIAARTTRIRMVEEVVVVHDRRATL